MTWLEGKKTYIFATLAMLCSIAHGLGWITTEQLTTLLGIFGGGAAFSLRSATKKTDAKIDESNERAAHMQQQMKAMLTPVSPPSVRQPHGRQSHDE
jgi:hypothetical protein